MFRRITKGGGHELLTSKEMNIRDSVKPDQTFSKYLEITKKDMKEVVTDEKVEGAKSKTVRKLRFPVIDYNGAIAFADTRTLLVQYNPEIFETGLMLLNVKKDNVLGKLPQIKQEDLAKVDELAWIVQVYLIQD